MSKYKTGKELIQEWKIKDFELFEHVKAGLQPFDQFGKPLSPPDISAKKTHRKKLKDESDSLKMMHSWITLSPKQRADYIQRDVVGALAAQQFSRLAQSDYERITKELESLDRELSQIPDDYWTRYELPDSGSGARRVLDLLLSVNYRTEDLKKIRKSSSPVALSVPKKSLIPNEGFKMEDVEAFLSSTKVAYESDIEIKIQSPKKPQMVYSFKDLGFKNPQNKGWQVIIQLLQMGFFFVGTFVKGDKNAEYDRHQKRLDACEQKLKIFFRQEYGLKIPDSFKFFRLSHDERPGTYKPIFSIAKSDLDNFEIKCKQLSGEQIKTEINSLTHECVKDGISQAKKNEIMPKLNILAAEAQRRGIVNYVTGRDNHEDNLDSEIGRDVPEDDREESSLE